MASAYHYLPLDREHQEIRVLTILPGCFDDVLTGRLLSIRLSDDPSPPYEALSYVWGSATHTSHIFIESASGRLGEIRINANLDEALRYLRLEDRERTIWVDALCINQMDSEERSQQVAMMSRVYSEADHVLVWLGREENDSSFAFTFMERIADNATVDWETRVVSAAESLEPDLRWLKADFLDVLLSRRETYAIHHLFGRAWFERGWIRQEIGLAKRASIRCGNVGISWNTFRVAFECMYSRAMFRFDQAELDEAHALFLKRSDIIYELVGADQQIYIHHLRSVTSKTKCFDPRDKIYAVLGLLCPADKQLNIMPDYSLTYTEIYHSVARTWYIQNKSLELLASCGVEGSQSTLPSWIPDWATASPYISGTGNSTGEDLQILYDPVFPNPGVLRVSGINFGTIATVLDLDYLQNDDDEISSQLDRLQAVLEFDDESIFEYTEGMTNLEACCRTLCMDKFADSYYPQRQWLPMSSDVLKILEKRRNGSTTDVLPESYLRRMLHVSAGRKFCRTSLNYMLLGPRHAEVGDILYTVLGCSVPLLLRRVETSEKLTPSITQHTVIGDCYVQGLMDLEAVYGHIPSPFTRVLTTTTNSGMWKFLNNETGIVQIEDPRLEGSLLDDIRAQMIKEKYDMQTTEK